METFPKPAISITEQIEKLRERGLIIHNEDRLRRYLGYISYFRLSAYTRPFYKPNVIPHRFLENTSFDNILSLYVFDRELRLILLDAIERIEISIRAQLGHTLAINYGPHGYTNPKIFHSNYRHDYLISKLEEVSQRKNIEPFLKHYHKKYPDAPPLPPIWMVMELLTFGEVARLLGNLRNKKDKEYLSSYFGWEMPILSSWIRSISDMRNICAHHSRLWNREFGSRPKLPQNILHPWPIIPSDIPIGTQTLKPQHRLYMQIAVVESFMRIISPTSRWSERLVQLLDQYPQISLPHMGFPQNWKEDPFWKDTVITARKTIPPSKQKSPRCSKR